MKKLLFIFSVLISFTYFSQISFYKTFSDGGYDVGEGVVQLADSSYLITGSSSSFQENNQAFILKLDSLGNKIWSNHYGGSEADRGRRVFHVPNDGIYVAGQTNSFGNFYDAYFFKTDENGTFLFEKNYGSSAYENIFDAVMLKDTSFILVGETTNTPNESENIYLLRINKFGDTLWTKNFGSEQKDVARAVELIDDSTLLIAGEYFVQDSLLSKGMLLKMDIDGTIDWLKTYGENGEYAFNDVHFFENEIRAVGKNKYDLTNDENIYQCMFKFDLDGNVNTAISETHDGVLSFEALVKYGLGNSYYFISKAENSENVNTYEEGSDIIVLKFHKALYYEFVSFYCANTGQDNPNNAIATSDGGMILVGENNYIKNTASNILVVKIGPNDLFEYSNTLPSKETLVNLFELDESSYFLNFYPNPFDDEIVFESNFENIKSLKVYSLDGKIVYNSSTISNKINLDFLKSGVYQFLIQTDEKIYRTRLIKN
jgi:hypothetical protein